jgi:diguanylate cyclase (GGDEF)-like protein
MKARPVALNEKTYVHPAIAVSDRPVLHATWLQTGMIATIILVLWAAIGVHLAQVRKEIARDAAQNTRNLAYAAEQDIHGMIAGIDQMLLFIRAARAADPKNFNIDRWFSDVRFLQGRYQFAIIDRTGRLEPNQLDAAAAPIDLSDRSHFQAQMNNPADELFISEPLLLRSTGKLSVQITRKLIGADGSFDGAVVMSMDPAWLTRLYGTLDIGEGALTVVGTDGVIRARAPGDSLGIGQNIGSSELVRSALAADHGSLRTVSQVNGEDQFVSFRRLPDYKLIVAIAVDADQVFAPYVQERLQYLIAGSVLTILTLMIGALVIRQNWRLLRSRRILSGAVDNISQGLLMIDADRQLSLISGRTIELLALPPELLARTPSYDDLLAWQTTMGEFGTGTEHEKWMLEQAEPSRSALQNGCYDRTRPDGRELEVRTQLLPGGGAMRTFTDITERKRSEARTLHLAHHDALTGLPNRTLLDDRLTQALRLAARTGGALAVLALDLDRFKAINDRFGHAAGDRLLVLATARLNNVLRASDTLARIGGDEFVVLQTDVGQPLAAGELALRLIKVLAEPFELEDRQLQVGTSTTSGVTVGIALYPVDGNNAETLLKNADTALYRAKASRRGSLCFFKAEMDLQLRERWALEQDLRQAIGTDQLRLHYQPIFASATRSITGFEALLRWQHPVQGNIPPMSFIPVAEETGLILAIGAWVMEEACRTAAAWAEPKRIAVNLSAVQLNSGELTAQVADVLRRTGLPARRLELEVTETMLITNHFQVLTTLRELRDMGVQIACDDFGTGYSSFSYLQNLAFDRIKIDKSFVQALGVSSSALRIVQAILAMAQSLGIDVTAEGVETERQFSMLHEQGCAEVQGFLLGRPVPADAVGQRPLDPPATAMAGLPEGPMRVTA